MVLWMLRAGIEDSSSCIVGLECDVVLESADDVLGGFLFGCASGSVGVGGVVMS